MMKKLTKISIKKFKKQVLKEKQTKQTTGGNFKHQLIDCLEC